ncbi:MAG: SatD family protein [bacterium]
MDFCVITADIRKSRDFPDRQVLQKQIIEAIARANDQFREHIVAEFAITLGDEWQGVLRDIVPSYQVVTFFQETLHPVSISFGVGEGAIETEIASRSVEMDGEVFHRSREALTHAKNHTQDVVFVTKNAASDLLLNSTLHLLQILKESWTDRQYQKVMLYKKLHTETRVANQLKVTQADINKALATTNGRVYLETEKNVNRYLEYLANTKMAPTPEI